MPQWCRPLFFPGRVGNAANDPAAIAASAAAGFAAEVLRRKAEAVLAAVCGRNEEIHPEGFAPGPLTPRAIGPDAVLGDDARYAQSPRVQAADLRSGADVLPRVPEGGRGVGVVGAPRSLASGGRPRPASLVFAVWSRIRGRCTFFLSR